MRICVASLAAAIAVLALCGPLCAAPRSGDRAAARKDAGPGLGQPAPDFELVRLDSLARHQGRTEPVKLADLEKVRLSSFRGKQPVVLAFGSYTCPPWRGQTAALERFYQAYKDRVAFLFVYIREAHPTDGWRLDQNDRAGIAYPQHKTLSERASVAAVCAEALQLTIPALVDDMNNTADEAFAAWPNRIYVIDKDGNVIMRGPKGPRGTDIPPAEEALKRLLDAAP